MKRLLLAATVCLLASGCGSSPSAPTPPPPQPANIAGNWSGTFQGTQAATGNFLTAVVMNLTQAGATVDGTWATSASNGTVSGSTTPTTFTGTFTFNGTGSAGACTGTFAVNGNAGGTTLNWTSPGVTGNCTNLPTNIVIAVQLR